MLEPKPRIVPRIFFLQTLVNAQRGVNGNVSIGVRANLPARQMRLAADRVEFFLGHDQNPVITRAPFVRCREPRGALGNGAVANQFDRSDAYPFIAKPGAVARSNHSVEVMKIDEAVGAMQQIACFPGVLIGAKVRWRTL